MKAPIRTLIICAAALMIMMQLGTAYDPLEEVNFQEITTESYLAIQDGLEYLAASQERDGSWQDKIGRKESSTYVGHRDKHVGATALAVMSFMSQGHFPGRGKYGENVRKGVAWLCRHIDQKGYISFSESRMYSHAFATLALAEAYGMSQREDVGDKLRKAVRLISAAQNSQGAWRYKPGAPDSDLSITVCQVMALRAARNAGVHVKKSVIDNAIDYVKRSFTTSGFEYQCYERSTRTSFALTAAGVVALQGAGQYDCLEARKGVDIMLARRFSDHQVAARKRGDQYRSFDYFYAHYYAVQGMFQAGGEYWAKWFPKVRDELVRGQNRNGSWKDLVGPNYATAMATIILQIPYRYLPIFER